MSGTLKSMDTMVKSVSEAGDYPQDQRKQQYYNNNPSDMMMMEDTIHAYHSGSGNSTLKKQQIVGEGSPTGTGNSSGRSLFPSLLNATLPSKLAIIVGLCQVGVGGFMVLTGILAIRYQSYLFHYGTGLWAGLLSSITGMIGAMCTKKGVPKPSWLCGGRKWQIHVFLVALVFSLSSVILLAIFSISGLLQDARTIMAVEEYDTDFQHILDSKNTTGILINTVLLLLSILQILLCFSSLGLAVRVMFKPSSTSLLSSKGSSGSGEMRQVMEGRKDHLIHWLGIQKNRPGMWLNMNKGPSVVAIHPVMYPPPPGRHHHMYPYPPPPRALYPVPMMPMPMSMPILSHSPYFCTPPPSLIIPTRNHPSRSMATATPISSVPSLSAMAQERERKRQRMHQRIAKNTTNLGTVSSNNSTGGILMGTKSLLSSSSYKAPSIISQAKTERSEKNNEVEVEEVDVSRTYTGLDRSIADEYITNSLNHNRKISSTMTSNTHDDDEDDDSGNEPEITRM